MDSLERFSAERWDDIVEVPFASSKNHLELEDWHGNRRPLEIGPGQYRVRYSARNVQAGWEADSISGGQPIDGYLLEFRRSADSSTDAVIRTTSDIVQTWHDKLSDNQ